MTTAAAGYYLPTCLDFEELETQHGGELTLDEARDVARALGAMARGHQWWIGDLLVHSEERFGEEFAQLEAELELEPRTVANYRWVAGSVKASRRREALSWSHHAEVGRLTATQQKKALERAEKDGMTVRELRDYVSTTWPAPEQTELPIPGPEPTALEEGEIQRRIERVELALEAGDVAPAIAGDVRWLLELAKRLTRHG